MHPGIESWKNLLVYAFNAFSIPLLFKTLFLPWEMDKNIRGRYTFLEKFVFAIFTRVLGFFSRVVFISIGLIFTVFVFLTFPIFLFLPIHISRERMQNFDSFGAFLSYGNTYTLNAHSRDVLGSSSILLFNKEKALRMIERGLGKDTNHNVLLVGDPGVGKSTLVEYLGRLGQSGLSFEGIRHHRVVELFVEGISLTDFDKCLSEAAAAGNAVLVIENIHLYTELYDRLMPS